MEAIGDDSKCQFMSRIMADVDESKSENLCLYEELDDFDEL